MKVCIAGYGSIGKTHADNLFSLGHEVAFLRTGLANAQRPATEGSFPEFYDKRELLGWEPQCLVVCTPTALHQEGIRFGIENGLHVYVEKPIGGSINETTELVKLARRNNLVLRVGYQMRFHPLTHVAKDFLVRAESLGGLQGFSMSWLSNVRTWHPWENVEDSYAVRSELGGGAINTLSHEFDLAIFLFGEIDWVDAVSTFGAFPGVEVGVDVLLKPIAGPPGTIQLRIDTSYRQRVLTLMFQESLVQLDFETNEIRHSGEVIHQPTTVSLHNQAYLASITDFIECAIRRDVDSTLERSIMETEIFLSSIRLASRNGQRTSALQHDWEKKNA